MRSAAESANPLELVARQRICASDAAITAPNATARRDSLLNSRPDIAAKTRIDPTTAQPTNWLPYTKATRAVAHTAIFVVRRQLRVARFRHGVGAGLVALARIAARCDSSSPMTSSGDASKMVRALGLLHNARSIVCTKPSRRVFGGFSNTEANHCDKRRSRLTRNRCWYAINALIV